MDVFPQPIKFTRAGPNATSDLGIEIRFPAIIPDTDPDHRVVTELLYMVFDWGGCFATLAASEVDSALFAKFLLTYSPRTALDGTAIAAADTIGDTNNIASWGVVVDTRITTSGQTKVIVPYTQNIDFKGGGLLGKIIPSDRIFLNVDTDSNLSTTAYGFELYYRQHRVGLREWFGIVASFQQNPS